MFLDDGWVGVRWYDPDADLPALVAVHAACFPSEDWRAEDFLRFASRTGGVVKAVVREDACGEAVIGTLLYRAGEAEARVRRVAVLPEYRGRGVGAFVLRSLVGPRSPNRRRVYTARVREHDLGAQKLLRAAGFSYTRTEPGCYPDYALAPAEGLVVDEDGYWFRFERPEPARRRRLALARPLMP